MNKKHKNKSKQNKPPNPLPPQKQTVEEKVDSDVVVQERVPEIISEVVVPHESDGDNTSIVETEVESPRKPKRNRSGKNKPEEKPNEKISAVEDKDNIIVSNIMPTEKKEEISATKQIIKEEHGIKEEVMMERAETIAPTARKKKGKNKKNADKIQVENLKPEVLQKTDNEKEFVNIKELSKSENIDSTQPSDKPSDIDFTLEEMSEIKKNNKSKKNKKNRIDSVKSVVSDVSRSVEKGEITDKTIYITVEDKKEDFNAAIEKGKIQVENLKPEVTLKTENEKELVDVIELSKSGKIDLTQPSDKPSDIDGTLEEMTEMKKNNKNKKSKKNKVDFEKSDVSKSVVKCDITDKTIYITPDENKDDIDAAIKKDEIKEIIETAVPENNIVSVITPQEDMSSAKDDNKSVNLGNRKKNEKKQDLECTKDTKLNQDIKEILHTSIKTEKIEGTCETSTINLKKEVAQKGDIDLLQPQTAVDRNIKEFERTEKMSVDESLPSPKQSTEFTEDIQDTHKGKKKNKKEKKQPVIPGEHVEPKMFVEECLNKRDNKSKGSEKKNSTSVNIEIKVASDVIDSQTKVTTSVSERELKPSSSDIELQDIKMGDCVVPENTPDSIEYPRSISEQSFTDGNNNMVIAEVNATEIQTLDVPVVIPDTPFIASSMESPVKLSDLIGTTISVTEIDLKLPEPRDVIGDKTDLKSKVLEVNQDMEELRLSIEKSLAELTALEKSEEMPELISITDTSGSKMAVDIMSSTAEGASSKIKDITTEIGPNVVTTKESNKADVIAHQNVITRSNTINVAIVPFQEKISIDFSESQAGRSTKLLDNVSEVSPKTIRAEQSSESLFMMSEPTKLNENVSSDTINIATAPPSCPSRKDHKGKGKSKKKTKQETEQQKPTDSSTVQTVSMKTETTEQASKTDHKEDKTSESTTSKKEQDTKKQSDVVEEDCTTVTKERELISGNIVQENNSQFDPIENFEDAMTSSVDDVNQSFELIANETNPSTNYYQTSIENPDINITSPQSDNETKEAEEKQDKENPLVSHPKNLLGHPDIPVQSSKTDYKKEKNKTLNLKQAKIKIKDAPDVEIVEKAKKYSKQSQTDNKPKVLSNNTTKPYGTYENEDYVYKYSFRKVFLPHSCHICKKDLKDVRISCNFCNLMFYCSQKHKDDDWAQHQAFCFAVSTIIHLKGLKHIYEGAKDVIGQNYRLLRMQVIVSCEKILKRRLVPWEQEALLYPRICAELSCREWRQNSLRDCHMCGQISYCIEKPDHCPRSHQRWCKSYSLYQKLVVYQQTKGRLEPRLPTKVMSNIDFEIPEKINELLANMYEEKIDMDDAHYAALTQLATAPLTAAYCYQVYNNKIKSTYANGLSKKSTFTLHIVGAELQFEADALHKWEIFFLHLKPNLKELRVVLVGPELNPSNLPLDLLANIKLCDHCRQNKRKVIFNFHDKELYHEFCNGNDFTIPDIVCAFNPSLNRTLGYKGKDSWPATINFILKLRTPFCVTSYTPDELPKDLSRIKEAAAVDFIVISEPSHNAYASIRPDRNFISDDEMPLLFKNYCYMILCGQI